MPNIEKIPPQSLDAEQAVLGAMLLSAEAISIVAERLDRYSFYKPAHRKIFQAIIDLYDKSITVDIISIAHALTAANQLEDAGGRAYLAGLTEATPGIANVEYHAGIVLEKSILNQLIEISNQTLSRVYDPTYNPDELLDETESALFKIKQRSIQGQTVNLGDILPGVVRDFKNICNGEVTGLPSGYWPLDLLSGGFQPADLIAIACRPSVGKTSFALNIIDHASVEQGKKSIMFSLEMSKEQIAQRLLCQRAHVSSHKIRTGYLSDEDWNRLGNAQIELTNANIFIDDTPALDSLTMRAKARRQMSRTGLDLIVVDYLQLMKSPRNEKYDNRDQQIGIMSQSLKQMAKELHVPTMILSQLNRQIELRGKDAKPQLSDLRESGNIEQDCDDVIFLHRPKDDSGHYKPETELILAKQRNGPTGTVDMVFVKDFTRFELADKYHSGQSGPEVNREYYQGE
jgi:replicative DNA helicase